VSISSEHINRRNNPDGTKGHTDVSSETDDTKGPLATLIGRRKLLALGGAGAAVMATGAGAAAALIRTSGSGATPRSQPAAGLSGLGARDPGAAPTASVARGGVRYLALAGTDGWATMPSATLTNEIKGAAETMYFPDPLAEFPNRTTYVFSFRNVTGLDREIVAAQKGRTQICAPLFFSTVGEELWVTLTNLGLQLRPDLVDGHTLHWHGFRNAIPFYDGVPESSISVPIGRDFTYVYRPEDSGTYMYHCHFEDVEHVTMGMQGIVFVKPEPSTILPETKQAYGPHDGDTTHDTRYDREFAILLGEIDNRAHFNDAHIQATDWTDFHADFSTMNGRAYPDTLQPNGWRDAQGDLNAQIDGGINSAGVHTFARLKDDSAEARLASNPLSSLVECAPGDRVLIRMVNLGFYNRTIVFPGLQVDVLGRDARYVPGGAQRLGTDSIQIGPGESRDVFFDAPASAGEYPFYDRDLSRYPGSADFGDAWVGGARSAVRVVSGLAPQLKPNGWGGEPFWDGEESKLASGTTLPAPPASPTISVAGVVVPNSATPPPRPGRYLQGSVALDSSATLVILQWAQANNTTAGATAPAGDSPRWRDVPPGTGNPATFNFRIGGNNGGARDYWVRAVDSNANATVSATVRF
jgi:FtsP/CotA-like multicopper oxidase with cupredoxin domain